MNDWAGCIIATIGLPEPSAFFGSRAFELPQEHSVDLWTHSWAAATEDLSDRGLSVQFACHIQIISTGNQAIFDADEILAKDTDKIPAGLCFSTTYVCVDLPDSLVFFDSLFPIFSRFVPS